VETLKGHTETGVEEDYHFVVDVRFAAGDKHRVVVSFINHIDHSVENAEYKSIADGTWQIVERRKGGAEAGYGGLQVVVKQTFDRPPVLVATDKRTFRVIWDPNPQLNNIELGQAKIYAWKDKEGREWKSGLFEPTNYKPGQRYPLVIQTHGFEESEFRPSGVFPTAFAARALAATGMAVLQVGGDCPVLTVDEGPCFVSGYETAANQLVSEGLVDPERIGIIGFSRGCFHVMEALTKGSLHFSAASITDGVMENYLQYMMWLDPNNESDSMIGAKPFGEGLQQWLKLSPGFNLDKVNAPLLINGRGSFGVLGMWEPYAGLRYLHKPVDLVMLNTDEHILTNPAVRMASQGGTVDWFRFWLKDEEDPDPAKAEQYARWRELRKLQQSDDRSK
jgi:dipeptidyl aminopeptidase/acylaminoacyl peptidase